VAAPDTTTRPHNLSPDLSPRLPAWLLLPQVRRGLFIWLPVHTAAWLGLWLLSYPPSTFAVTRLSAFLIIAATAALAAIDARIMRESLFYANMGMPRWLPATAAAATAATMEIAILVLL
jgi:hypothetical protein